METTTLSEINQRIDEILVSCLGCYEESKRVREELNKKYGDGLCQLAKARVAMFPTGKITQVEMMFSLFSLTL
jgi:hypothetical protein